MRFNKSEKWEKGERWRGGKIRNPPPRKERWSGGKIRKERWRGGKREESLLPKNKSKSPSPLAHYIPAHFPHHFSNDSSAKGYIVRADPLFHFFLFLQNCFPIQRTIFRNAVKICHKFLKEWMRLRKVFNKMGVFCWRGTGRAADQ